jgi:hypothetical protein
VAADRQILLGEGQLFAGRDPELQLDEVEPRDRLGDRMLDLQPGVHLHEEETVRPQAVAAVAMNSTVPAPT